MADAKLEEIYQNPGDVVISQLELISPRGIVVSLKEFLVELNIYESMFSPTLTGSIILSDSRNLLKELPILGEELLVVEIRTPTFGKDLSIYKTFRVYSVKDKVYSGDGSAQLYKLNFSSVELFRDISNNISKSYAGKIPDIISNIYYEYLACPRNINVLTLKEIDKVTELTILNNPDNVIKFVSPNWTPIQCINWLCSKSLSKNSANFLFWETTKGFYFGSTDSIFSARDKVNIGNYLYSSSFVSNLESEDLNKRLATIKTLTVNKALDQLANNLDGYIANRLIDINLYDKTYEYVDYDHAINYFKYSHTKDSDSFPLFNTSTSRNYSTYQQINYKYPRIYDNITDNFSETTKFIFGNRRSNMLELDNFKMTIGIPGRTDIEVGNLININLPKAFPAYTEDTSTQMIDEMYSGYYLITSLNHKINPLTHFITCEVTKDCISKENHYGK